MKEYAKDEKGEKDAPEVAELEDAAPEAADDASELEEVGSDVDDVFDVKKFVTLNFCGPKQGHELEKLVAQILGAMGYECDDPEKGPDGGIDILASRNLTEVVCVQVKSSTHQKGAPHIQSLAGTMGCHSSGLFVAWGGFGGKKNEKRLRKQFQSIRLWNAEDVLRLVDEYYDKFDEEFKKRLPLKRELVVDYSALESEDVV